MHAKDNKDYLFPDSGTPERLGFDTTYYGIQVNEQALTDERLKDKTQPLEYNQKAAQTRVQTSKPSDKDSGIGGRQVVLTKRGRPLLFKSARVSFRGEPVSLNGSQTMPNLKTCGLQRCQNQDYADAVQVHEMSNEDLSSTMLSYQLDE